MKEDHDIVIYETVIGGIAQPRIVTWRCVCGETIKLIGVGQVLVTHHPCGTSWNLTVDLETEIWKVEKA